MEESKGLAYNDPQSGSDATVIEADSLPGSQLSPHDESADSLPDTLRGSAPRWLGSPMEQMLPLVAAVASVDMVEVHVPKAQLDDL